MPLIKKFKFINSLFSAVSAALNGYYEQDLARHLRQDVLNRFEKEIKGNIDES